MKRQMAYQFSRMLFALLILGVTGAQAQSLNYRSIDFPNATRTRAFGINPSGNIVGDYRDSLGNLHGFVLSGGRFITVDAPGWLAGASGTLPTGVKGISPSGQIVGIYFAPPGSSADCTTATSPACIKGFLFSGGGFSNVRFPGHPGAIPQRITPNGDIYGCYHDFDLMASMFAFVRTRSRYSGLDIPASMHTGATPDGSTVVGLYNDQPNTMTGLWHGYLLQSGNFQPFDPPGSTFTQAWDINPDGNIVGVFSDNAGTHGFLRTVGAYTPIDYVDPTTGNRAAATQAFGINPAGAIVGQYTDAGGRTHGFVALPSE